jgi:lipopolysaccharide export system protein LptA
LQADHKIVLTGGPVVRHENDLVEGDRITLFLKENRSIVESSGSGRVRALIFPGGKKK